MAETIICSSCGCELEAKLGRCPVCGAQVQARALEAVPDWEDDAATGVLDSVPAREPEAMTSVLDGVSACDAALFASERMKGNGSHVPQHGKPFSCAKIARIVLVVAFVVVICIMITGPITSMGGRANEPSSYDGKYGAPVSTVTSGGVALETGVGAYAFEYFEEDAATSPAGLYYDDDLDPSSDDFRGVLVSADTGSCLNFYDDNLYYLTDEDDSVSTLDEAQQLRVLENPKHQSTGSGDCLYSAADGSYLTSLHVYDGQAYFIEANDASQTFAAKRLPLQEGASPETLLTAPMLDGSRAWTYVEDGKAHVVHTGEDGTWKLEAAELDQSPPVFSTELAGKGELECFVPVGEQFYFALNQMNCPLRCTTPSGEQREIGEVRNTVRLAADGSYIIALERDGTLTLTHASSGITAHLQSPGITQVKGTDGFAVFGDDLWVCGKDEGFSLNGNLSSVLE